MTTGNELRVGEAEAFAAALAVERSRTRFVSEDITREMVAAAYPVIAAAVREHFAEDARWFADQLTPTGSDYYRGYGDALRATANRLGGTPS